MLCHLNASRVLKYNNHIENVLVQFLRPLYCTIQYIRNAGLKKSPKAPYLILAHFLRKVYTGRRSQRSTALTSSRAEKIFQFGAGSALSCTVLTDMGPSSFLPRAERAPIQLRGCSLQFDMGRPKPRSTAADRHVSLLAVSKTRLVRWRVSLARRLKRS